MLRRLFLGLGLTLVLPALPALQACGAPAADPPAAALTPDLACGPGQRPGAGGSCAAVGTNAVPAGFSAEPWGFRPDAPQEPCTGASIALLGAKACEPIDDCGAAFPPANADVAVRKSGATYEGRPDLAVVSTLDEAVARAKAGATIAIDEGEFASPSSFTKSVRFVGRCAERTAIVGTDFVARIEANAKIGFQSLALTGASKVALLVNTHATVDLDRVYVHGPGNGAQVANGALLSAKRTVFEGPVSAANPNAATNGLYAIYGGHLALDAVEMRGFQNALEAESVGTDVRISKSILHEQVALDAEQSALGQIGAFLGARVTIDSSHVESAPGRIAIVGAERLDGQPDKTSPGNPPATLTVTNSSLVHALVPRDIGSAIDVGSGASLELENVSLRHDSFAGIGASEGASVSLRSSVIQGGASPKNTRSALSALKGAKLTIESSALVASTQFAIVLDGASSASLEGSLVTGNREIGIKDATSFMGAAQAISIARDGHATLHDSALIDNEGTSIFLQDATVQLDATVLAGTRVSSFGRSGVAIMSIDSVVAVRASTITKNQVALAVRGGRALLRDSAVTDHGDAIQLEGVTFVQTEDARDDAPEMQVLAARTTFARNARLATARPLTGE